MIIHEISVKTKKRTDFIDITGQVADIVNKSEVADGTVVIFVPHTTAAVTINENADPDVMRDISLALDKVAPWNDPQYRHQEGNTAAHLKASMFGSSETIFFSGKRLILGVWQGIYFAEFDGPRTRKALIRISKYH